MSIRKRLTDSIKKMGLATNRKIENLDKALETAAEEQNVSNLKKVVRQGKDASIVKPKKVKKPSKKEKQEEKVEDLEEVKLQSGFKELTEDGQDNENNKAFEEVFSEETKVFASQKEEEQNLKQTKKKTTKRKTKKKTRNSTSQD